MPKMDDAALANLAPRRATACGAWGVILRTLDEGIGLDRVELADEIFRELDHAGYAIVLRNEKSPAR